MEPVDHRSGHEHGGVGKWQCNPTIYSLKIHKVDLISFLMERFECGYEKAEKTTTDFINRHDDKIL